MLDYLSGPPTEAVLAALAPSHGGGPGVRYVIDGASAGTATALPTSVVASTPLTLMGSGIGGLSVLDLVQAAADALQIAGTTDLQIDLDALPLSEITEAWLTTDDRRRIVVTTWPGSHCRRFPRGSVDGHESRCPPRVRRPSTGGGFVHGQRRRADRPRSRIDPDGISVTAGLGRTSTSCSSHTARNSSLWASRSSARCAALDRGPRRVAIPRSPARHRGDREAARPDGRDRPRRPARRPVRAERREQPRRPPAEQQPYPTLRSTEDAARVWEVSEQLTDVSIRTA